jgi:hypothetical protein
MRPDDRLSASSAHRSTLLRSALRESTTTVTRWSSQPRELAARPRPQLRRVPPRECRPLHANDLAVAQRVENPEDLLELDAPRTRPRSRNATTTRSPESMNSSASARKSSNDPAKSNIASPASPARYVLPPSGWCAMRLISKSGRVNSATAAKPPRAYASNVRRTTSMFSADTAGALSRGLGPRCRSSIYRRRAVA